MPAIAAMDEVEAGEASLLAEAPEAWAAAEEAPALPAPRASPLDRSAVGGRRGAAGLAIGLLLGCAAAALAVSELSGRSGESAASSKVSDSGAQLWGFSGGGGACGTQGCDCDCAWASNAELCRPEANDGKCCWSCCCGGQGNANGGNGNDGFAGGNAGAYPRSSYYPQTQQAPQGGNAGVYSRSSYYPQPEEAQQGYVHHTFAIHDTYSGHHTVHRFSVITILWIFLFIGLCLMGCMALYIVLQGKK